MSDDRPNQPRVTGRRGGPTAPCRPAPPVPDRRAARRGVLLPFDDARQALILGKAFPLAADREITDPSVLRQTERGA
ncbi:hypothetical protein [Streptomyces sp. NPDC005017]|uniref:DUF7737 domain-containing protein n=1 Tax=Streptomyces sp. NPDC005017 TaxID=3364706 RepID=UPI00369A7F79